MMEQVELRNPIGRRQEAEMGVEAALSANNSSSLNMIHTTMIIMVRLTIKRCHSHSAVSSKSVAGAVVLTNKISTTKNMAKRLTKGPPIPQLISIVRVEASRSRCSSRSNFNQRAANTS